MSNIQDRLTKRWLRWGRSGLKQGAKQTFPQDTRLERVGDSARTELFFIKLNQSTKSRWSCAVEKAEIPLAGLGEAGNLVGQAGIGAIEHILIIIMQRALLGELCVRACCSSAVGSGSGSVYFLVLGGSSDERKKFSYQTSSGVVPIKVRGRTRVSIGCLLRQAATAQGGNQDEKKPVLSGGRNHDQHADLAHNEYTSRN